MFSRRLAIASVLFGLFVVCDILLFTWMLSRSLSQHEMDRVLLETRAEARNLAEKIVQETGPVDLQGKDLYFIMASKRELLRYIESELVGREVVREIKIYDRDGNLVFRTSNLPSEDPLSSPDVEQPSPEVAVPSPEEWAAGGALEGAEALGFSDDLEEVAEEIGDLGMVSIGISTVKVRERAAILRRGLVRQTVWIIVVSVAMLLSAYGVILLLLRRARAAEEQAREADRLAYIGTLAAGLAHEIRNPLNSLNLNMQMLEEEIAEGPSLPTGQRLLGITRQEISRLERLVTDFLLYARPRPADLEEVAPRELLGRVRELLAPEAAARGASLVVRDESRGARLRVDREQMTQLLLNLAQNALAAIEETSRPGKVTLAAWRDGEKLSLGVEDNGVGISAEEKDRIFEIFYSTRKGGTGLGLAVVERIARSHDGEIHLESEPGEGTRVFLQLPIAARRDAVTSALEESGPLPEPLS